MTDVLEPQGDPGPEPHQEGEPGAPHDVAATLPADDSPDLGLDVPMQAASKINMRRLNRTIE